MQWTYQPEHKLNRALAFTSWESHAFFYSNAKPIANLTGKRRETVAKDTKKRVVGVLLGTRSRNSVDVTNSFAVPFEEDSKNPAARGGVENVKLLDARRGGCAPSASSRTFRCELDLGRAHPGARVGELGDAGGTAAGALHAPSRRGAPPSLREPGTRGLREPGTESEPSRLRGFTFTAPRAASSLGHAVGPR